jgi:hypothetical protein
MESAPTAIKWRSAAAEFKEFVRLLELQNHPVIDHFLGENPKLQDIGKLLIALTILEREAVSRQFNYNVYARDAGPGQDDWLRTIRARLTAGVRDPADLLKNQVHFVTFNYDTSLEENLHIQLSTVGVLNQEIVDQFLSRDRLLHVYGSIRDFSNKMADPIRSDLMPTGFLPFQPPRPSDLYRAWKEVLDIAFAASKRIKTIAPHEKVVDGETLSSARVALQAAEDIYFLGFGFDQTNCELLDVEKAIRGPNLKQIRFTNYGDLPKVNMAAATGMFGASEAYYFFDQGQIGRSPSGLIATWQRSRLNVYDAFEKDFHIQ